MLSLSFQRTWVICAFIAGIAVAPGCGNDSPADVKEAAPQVSTAAPGLAPSVALPPPPPIPTDEVLLEQNAERVAAIVRVRDALEKYATDHKGEYPLSHGDAQGYHSQWGESLGANWLPELVPNYLAELPRDPAGALFSNGPMYLYMSNGKSYKLIAHGVPNCPAAKLSDGVAIDPARSSGADNCWAYGVWSAGGERF